MFKRAKLDLTALSPREEGLARVALANAPEDRPGRGLSAAVGKRDGAAVIFTTDIVGGEEPGISGASASNTEVEVSESRE